jgi:uncharacterized membrane protein
MLSLALALHTLAAVIWVGGMFFAHMALRPSVMELQPPDRLGLWSRVFPRFFAWVWASVITLLLTGYGVIYLGYQGMAGVGMHVHIMQATGLLMMAVFVFIYFGPFQAFRRAMEQGDMPAAALAQGRIRKLVAFNLPLGLFTAAIGATGNFWG